MAYFLDDGAATRDSRRCKSGAKTNIEGVAGVCATVATIQQATLVPVGVKTLTAPYSCNL